ncbi:MAG TPA: formylmethanofuran dehydrogenase subunit B [Methanospirillum sp.]|nr:formylmethanofuran dehydrogenase subunit B [Methanospirillum sp.]
MSKVVTDVTCPFCGTLCDDLVITVSDDENEILDCQNACAIGAEKFLHAASHSHRETRPRKRQPDGSYKEISYDEAIEYTAQLLAKAKKTLWYGWASTSCEAMAIGHKVAEKAGTMVDNCATVCHGSSLLAIQDVGVPSCTLGEVKNRADRVVFWGCNPAHAHPRHMSRYSIFPRGFFTTKGHKGRKIIVVDCRYTDTAKCADEFIQIDQSYDYEVLDAFRTVVRGEPIPDVVGGVPKEKIIAAVDCLKEARFGVIFFGMGLTHTLGRNHNIDIAINLTRDLNDYTKFSIVAMRGHWNVTGSGQVLSWQYGFPFCVDLTRRTHARYQPGDTSSVDLLRRKEVDACICIASDIGAHFPIEATRHMAQIPSVCIDPHINLTTEISDVHIPVAMVGVEVEGCAYRMDNVPMRCRKVVNPPEGMLTDEELLEKIYVRLCEIMGDS